MATKRERKLFKKALWFQNKQQFDIDYFDLLHPHRQVSHKTRYKSGIFYSQKCGRDIQHESDMELRFVEQLEANPRVAFYWDQPVKIPFWRGRRKVTYTPDYGIYLKSGHIILAEVKTLPDMLDFRVQTKTEALMAFCSERGFGLLLTDGRHTPDHFKKGRINPKLERTLLSALDIGPLGKEQCREIMHRCNATNHELHKTIIRHNLKFRSYSMKLQRGRDNRIFRQVFFEHLNYEHLIDEQFSTLFKHVG